MGKKGLLSALLFGAGALVGTLAGAFVGVSITDSLYLDQQNMERRKGSEGKTNLVRNEIFKYGKIGVCGDIDNAYITCVSSFVDVMIERPEHDEMNLEITAHLSTVRIHKPDWVIIDCDPDYLGYLMPEYEDGEDYPVIHVTVNSVSSNVEFV